MSATGQEPEAPETPEAPSAPAAAPTEGLDRMFARMDEIAQQVTGIGSRVDGITQLVTPVEDEPDYYEPDGSLSEDGARALIQQMVDERVQEQLAPREAARQVELRDQAFEDLRDEYPELREEATAQRILGAAIRWANSVDPRIVDRPEFVEIIENALKAEKFDTLAAQQAAEQPRSVVLESGQGAARQVASNEPDWADRIVKAAERQRPQI